MAYLAGQSLLNTHQLSLSTHHLAALGAGLLFIVEGALLLALVLRKKPIAENLGSISPVQ